MPGLGQVEAADLVGGAVPVLGGPQHAQARVPVALELADDVHEVLERARSGDRPVLGHVADQHDGHVPGLGGLDHRGADLPHLRDAAAVPSTCADAMVCTLSTTSRSGSCCSMCPSTVARSVSATSRSVARARGCGPRADAPARPTPRRSRRARDVRCARRGRRRRAAGSTCRRRARRPGAPRRRARGRRRAPGRARRPRGLRPARSRRRSGRSAARWTSSAPSRRSSGAAPGAGVLEHRAPRLALAAAADPLGRGPAALGAVKLGARQRLELLPGRFTLVEVTSRTLDAGSDTDVDGTRNRVDDGLALVVKPSGSRLLRHSDAASRTCRDASVGCGASGKGSGTTNQGGPR